MGNRKLEQLLTKCFFTYGHVVGGLPTLFFLIPLLATVLLAPAIMLMNSDENVLLLFTPHKAPSRNELRVFNEFSMVEPLRLPDHLKNRSTASEGDEQKFKSYEYLLQSAKNEPRANPWAFLEIFHENRSNIMNQQTLSEVSELLDYVFHNFTCKVKHSSDDRDGNYKILKYNPNYCDLDSPNSQCIPWDKHVKTVTNLMNRTNLDPSRIKLTYPVMYVMDRPTNWGQIIYGAEINETSKELLTAKVLVLKLDVQFDLRDNGEYEARQCMDQLAKYVHSQNDKGSSLIYYFNTEWYQNHQVSTVTKEHLLPFIALTIILVTIFTTVSSFYSRAPIMGAAEAILGVLTIGLSLVTSFGLLFSCGVAFNFVTIIVPFLILCVGIDNDFLLTSAWRSVEIDMLPPRERLARAFADCGPSLAITSINDILCFAVGSLLSDSPAIADFCLFTCVALTLRFVYQLTFFSGALVYLTEHGWERSGGFLRMCEHHLASWMKKMHRHHRHHSPLPLKNSSNDSLHTDGGMVRRETGSAPPHPPSQAAAAQLKCLDSPSMSISSEQQVRCCWSPENIAQTFFRDRFSRFLAKKWVRVVSTFAFAAYLVAAAYGASRLEINISLRKLVYDYSSMQTYFEIAENYVMKSQIGNIIVTKAPDFRQSSEIDKFFGFVDAIERTSKYSPTPNDTTTLWLRDYIDFRSQLVSDWEEDTDFYRFLPEFFSASEYKHYISDLRFAYSNDGQLLLESFRFMTYYQNIDTWDDSMKLLLMWREVCANYSEYGAIVQEYLYRNTYLDQRLTLAGTTLQTMGLASLMIALVTCLLMPDMASMFFICFSSLSVDLGVIAGLNAWGSDLDPVTMACLLMTIGFSVYYTARMCYCYQKSPEHGASTLVQKFAYTLGTIGWPVLQGGLGTLVGSLPLIFVSAYMVRTFFRTIVLVVIIGLMHGLVFIPVMMSLYDKLTPAFRKLRLRRRTTRKCCV